jgi:hypothetical protein
MLQDNTDTNNEGTHYNNHHNNNRDQGPKTNDGEFNEEENHHKMTTGTETEMVNDIDTTKMAAVHNEGDNEHGDTVPYDEECKRAQEMSLTSLGP